MEQKRYARVTTRIRGEGIHTMVYEVVDDTLGGALVAYRVNADGSHIGKARHHIEWGAVMDVVTLPTPSEATDFHSAEHLGLLEDLEAVRRAPTRRDSIQPFRVATVNMAEHLRRWHGIDVAPSMYVDAVNLHAEEHGDWTMRAENLGSYTPEEIS